MQSLRPIMIIMLLCGVLVAPLAAMDMVLCFGADGHITLEPLRNGRCGTSMPLTTPSQDLQVAEAEHCGPCLDVPFLTAHTGEQMLAMTTTWVPLPMPVLTCVTVSVLLPVRRFPPSFHRTVARVLSPTLVALRTVILLI